jgi:hypothetical protein
MARRGAKVDQTDRGERDRAALFVPLQTMLKPADILPWASSICSFASLFVPVVSDYTDGCLRIWSLSSGASCQTRVEKEQAHVPLRLIGSAPFVIPSWASTLPDTTSKAAGPDAVSAMSTRTVPDIAVQSPVTAPLAGFASLSTRTGVTPSTAGTTAL